MFQGRWKAEWANDILGERGGSASFDKSALAIVGTSASGNVPAAERIEDHGIPLPRPSHLYLPRLVSFVRAYTGSVLLYIQQWQLWKYMV